MWVNGTARPQDYLAVANSVYAMGRSVKRKMRTVVRTSQALLNEVRLSSESTA